ncbi:MAG: hypothetical protein LBP59_12070 [Planctomycetaceae bacterium]|jgi:hypothetical protein|nr:hypothetical protein [Planctomycetaceae bacterium]
MFREIRIFFVFCFSVVNCGISICEESAPSADDIFSSIIKSRQSIQSGEIDVASYYSDKDNDDETDAYFGKDKIYFDGSKIRLNTDDNNLVVCVDHSKKTGFYYNNVINSGGYGSGIGSYNALTFENLENNNNNNNNPKISARATKYINWIGYLPGTISDSPYWNPLEFYDLKSDKYEATPRVYSESILDIDCWRVDVKFRENNDVLWVRSVWVDKSDVSRVICVERCLQREAGDRKLLQVERLESKTEKFKNSIWFPTKLKYKQRMNKKITQNYEATIKVISLNEPLAADLFSPKGISFLKPDTPVNWRLDRDRPAEGELKWDGEKIVPAAIANASIPQPQPQAKPTPTTNKRNKKTTTDKTKCNNNVQDKINNVTKIINIILLILLCIAVIIWSCVGVKILQEKCKRNKNANDKK